MIPRIRGFSLWGGGGVNAIKILGILSILGGENRVVGSLCVIPKMFPYMSMRVGQVRPHRTCRHGSPSVKGRLSIRGSFVGLSGRCTCWLYTKFSYQKYPHHDELNLELLNFDLLFSSTRIPLIKKGKK